MLQAVCSLQSSYLLIKNHGKSNDVYRISCSIHLLALPLMHFALPHVSYACIASDSTSLYVSGSLQRGRLSQPNFFDPHLIPDDQEPVPHQISQATLVDLPEECRTVKEIAAGFEHALLLSSTGGVYGTGTNYDRLHVRCIAALFSMLHTFMTYAAVCDELQEQIRMDSLGWARARFRININLPS